MSTLLIRLNGAHDDEVEELRTLLVEHAIEFYETDAGRWGFSVAGFWLRNAQQLEQAQRLINDYQQERSARVQAEHALQVEHGLRETMLTRFSNDPLRTLLYLLLIAVVIYISLLPFIGGL